MGYTVSELLSRLDSRELSEWVAYSTLEPFGDARADLRAASIVQSNILPHVGKGKRAPSLKDCMLHFERPEPETANQMMDKLKAYTISKGGKVVGNNKHISG